MQNIMRFKNLKERLNGELPITREELIHLVNSWGRKNTFSTLDLVIYKTKPSNKYNLENLDVSQISDFSQVFESSYYNGNLSKWNMSNALNMDSMFLGSDFNNDSICNWNLPNLESLKKTFQNTIFNFDLSNWNFSKVKYIDFIFFKNKEFNQPFNGIDTKNLLSMNYSFAYAEKFNQPLDKLITKNVNNFSGAFFNAKSFNQSLDNWNVSKGKDFSYMLTNSKSPTNILLWDINKKANMNYFALNNKELFQICNKGNNIPDSTNNFFKWLEKTHNKILYREQMKDKFSKENTLKNDLEI